MAPTAHCAAHRAQYPKDHTQDDQDHAEHPKNADVEDSTEDEQDDPKDDQRAPPVRGGLFSVALPVPGLALTL